MTAPLFACYENHLSKDPFHYFDLETKQSEVAKLEMSADERERKTEGGKKERREESLAYSYGKL